MSDLATLAAELLTAGKVKAVIGWSEGTRGLRPAFATDPAEARTLVFDHRAVHNLAAYLSPRRGGVVALGRPLAVAVKGCDARAAAGLIREAQVRREDVVLIGVRCGGVTRDPRGGTLDAGTVSPRCPGCAVREPSGVDHVVGEALPPPPGAALEDEVAALEGKSPAERLAFFKSAFARCTRCGACQAACPLCACVRCVAEKTRPQWIPSAPHPGGTFTFHLVRALHLAGRCAGCLECERACPAGIPLGLVAAELGAIARRRFGHEVDRDPTTAPLVGAHRPDDPEEFIR